MNIADPRVFGYTTLLKADNSSTTVPGTYANDAGRTAILTHRKKISSDADPGYGVFFPWNRDPDPGWEKNPDPGTSQIIFPGA
jgi:hypothetical protein